MTTHNHREHAHDNLYTNITITELPESQISISGDITLEALTHFREHALEHYQAELELPGFRKGKVPTAMVIERVGELALLEEAGESVLNECLGGIIRESKYDVIGMPQASITKLALGSPLSFTIKAAILPAFTLTDYKKIAKAENAKKEVAPLGEKEIDEAILAIRRMQAQKNPEEKIEEKDLPELTDDLVKTFGHFETIADFKEKVTDSLRKEKELRSKEKNRLSIIKEIIKETTLTLPRLLIDNELERMFAHMSDDISRMGVKIEDYLTHLKKTKETLFKEWEEDAIERAKMELLLGKIAVAEEIDAPEEEIQTEIKHMLEHYQDADPIRAASYFEHVIRNEKVFQFLENQN